MTGTPLLRASGIALRRGGRLVLDGVDLEVRAGEVVGLLGPNGAGKSSLLGVLAGDLEPDEGEVELAGRPLREMRRPARARARSVLLQQQRPAFGFRVDDLVAMGRSPWRGLSTAEEDLEAVSLSLAATDSGPLAQREATSLSGGEAARAAFARTLAQEAPLVLLDEPAAAMDVRYRELVHALARELAAAGCGVLLIGHDLDTAAAWSDRIALLHRGRMLACGAPRDILSPRLLGEVYGVPIEVIDLGAGGLVVRPKRRAPGA